MKKIYLFALVMLCSCTSDFMSYEVNDYEDPQSDFEITYIERFYKLTKSSNNSIQLIGYTTVNYSGEEADQVKQIWKEHKSEMASAGYYYVENSSLRVYFPLKNAIVRIDGLKYTADNDGVVVINDNKFNSIKIIARDKTDRSVYTKFKSRIEPESIYRDYNTYVFNMGCRNVSCCDTNKKTSVKGRSESSSGAVACVNNHAPYRNCTEAFPQYARGRCETKYDRCMDYNGVGTDCSGSHLYFVDSDCCVAIAHGECWNEIGMRE